MADNQKIKPTEPVVLRVTDFSGGLNTTVVPSLLNPNEGQRADNVNYDQKGTISPQKGRIKRYASDFGPNFVAGLGAYYSKAGTSHLLIASGTEIYTDEPHMDERWNIKADWQKGTVEGQATLDHIEDKLTNDPRGVTSNTVQTISASGSTGTGAYLRVTGWDNASVTAEIRRETTAEEIKTRLEALPDVGAGNVKVVSHIDKGDAFETTVEFIGKFEGQEVPLLVYYTRSGFTSHEIKYQTKGRTIELPELDADADALGGTLENVELVENPERGTVLDEFLNTDPRVVLTNSWSVDVNTQHYSGQVLYDHRSSRRITFIVEADRTVRLSLHIYRPAGGTQFAVHINGVLHEDITLPSGSVEYQFEAYSTVLEPGSYTIEVQPTSNLSSRSFYFDYARVELVAPNWIGLSKSSPATSLVKSSQADFDQPGRVLDQTSLTLVPGSITLAF